MSTEPTNSSSLEEKLEAVEKSVGELLAALHFLIKEDRNEAVVSIAAIQQNLLEIMMLLSLNNSTNE